MPTGAPGRLDALPSEGPACYLPRSVECALTRATCRGARARGARLNGGTVLTCLRVRSFAIIDELEVELEPGMNVVTGETGAGKSILIDALELVLGARARPEVVR